MSVHINYSGVLLFSKCSLTLAVDPTWDMLKYWIFARFSSSSFTMHSPGDPEYSSDLSCGLSWLMEKGPFPRDASSVFPVRQLASRSALQETCSGLHHVFVEMHPLSDPDGGVIEDGTAATVLVFAMVHTPWPDPQPYSSRHMNKVLRYSLSFTAYRAKPIVGLSQAVATRTAAITSLRDFDARRHATFPGGWSITPQTSS